MDHLKELQGRLFSTVFVFILVAAAAYPFFDKIATWIMAPLKEGQELVYLTPGGAFSFIIKVCAYIGLIGTLPVLIYHIYRFIMPAVRRVKLRTVLFYTISSMVLATIGILFAYYVSLPASLYFLTGFNLNHINPMLTIDAYFSFVMTYMLAGALLFQLPLVMMIINSVTPLTPKKLMKAQDKIIIGSFIVAAVISPTPDALNQALLASPMVVMYQVGIILIWRKNRKLRKRAAKASARHTAHESTQPIPVPSMALPAQETALPVGPAIAPAVVLPRATAARRKPVAMDIIGGVRPQRPVAVSVPPRDDGLHLMLPARSAQETTPKLGMRSLDGVIRMRPTV